MAKKRRSVSLSEENDEFLKDHPNASHLVNELVTEYREGGGEDESILRYRLEELESERESLEQRAKHKEQQADKIRSQLTTENQRKQQVIEEAAETLTVDPDPESKPMKHWAEKAGMTPGEFAEAYKEEQDE